MPDLHANKQGVPLVPLYADAVGDDLIHPNDAVARLKAIDDPEEFADFYQTVVVPSLYRRCHPDNTKLKTLTNKFIDSCIDVFGDGEALELPEQKTSDQYEERSRGETMLSLLGLSGTIEKKTPEAIKEWRIRLAQAHFDGFCGDNQSLKDTFAIKEASADEHDTHELGAHEQSVHEPDAHEPDTFKKSTHRLYGIRNAFSIADWLAEGERAVSLNGETSAGAVGESGSGSADTFLQDNMDRFCELVQESIVRCSGEQSENYSEDHADRANNPLESRDNQQESRHDQLKNRHDQHHTSHKQPYQMTKEEFRLNYQLLANKAILEGNIRKADFICQALERLDGLSE